MMKKRLIACGVCLWTAFCMLEARNEKPAVYKDAKAPTEKRVEDLLLRMTMEEKVLQLSQYVAGRNTNANNIGEEVKNIPAEIGALLYYSTSPHLRNNIQKKAMEESRLGIPVLFGHDVIHGFRTVYPISIAQACSWNPALVEKACAMAAREARLAGLDWTFSPMIDVARDPRWGRVSEGYGEDPYTNGVFAVASVKGYQGNNLADGEHIAACLKHYIGYGASEAGRDYVYTEISPQTLWDTYMLPYEMGVKAGAVTLMSGFHDISGVPASANHYTMREVLKGRWSHDGFVVSDWGSIVQLISQGAAEDLKEASEKAIMAGVDMDMMSRGYDKYLKELVGEGKVPVEIVDDAVRRILRLKFRLGLFENPYIRETTEKERFLQPEDIKIAEKLAEESFVLLKNKEKRLPLAADTKVAAKYLNPDKDTVQEKAVGKEPTETVPVQRAEYQTTSGLSQPVTDSAYIASLTVERNYGFNTAVGNSYQMGTNTIAACISENQIIEQGGRVKLRLLQPLQAGNITVPENSLVTGAAVIQGERLDILISSIEYAGNIIPVQLATYDIDGQKGIFVPGSETRNAAKDAAGTVSESMGNSVSFARSAGQQVVMDLTRGVMQGGTRLIAGRVRAVKVTLKAGYKVLLVTKRQ